MRQLYRVSRNAAAGLFLALAASAEVSGDEKPYFVTYDHHMEEPGAMEFAFSPLIGFPKGADQFYSGLFEVGYGLKGWWTTEVYLAHQYTWGQEGAFTGVHWENRFRPFQGELWINPVLYVEYAHTNEADRSFKEVVGHSDPEELEEPVSELKQEIENELELKLILSRDHKGWNLAGNFIAEKNLSNHPWEFGYAAGFSRPLALAVSPNPCRLCLENFRAGVEFYGGLGDAHAFGFGDTSQYLAPVLLWRFTDSTSLCLSPTFGITDGSIPFMMRFGILYEIGNFPGQLRSLVR
jgi:hypothetical protein